MHDVKLPRLYRGRHNPKCVVTVWKVGELIRLYDMELPPSSKLLPFIRRGDLVIETNRILLNNSDDVSRVRVELYDPDTRVVIEGEHIFSFGETFFNENYEPITVTTMDDTDNVKHPAHYTRGKIEVWDFIIDQDLNYCSGNIVKYVCRAGEKSSTTHIEDLEKAKAYLEREIRRVKEQKDV